MKVVITQFVIKHASLLTVFGFILSGLFFLIYAPKKKYSALWYSFWSHCCIDV